MKTDKELDDTISHKTIQAMQKFAQSYAKSTNTYFCCDSDVTNSVIQGLANNKQTLSEPGMYADDCVWGCLGFCVFQ